MLRNGRLSIYETLADAAVGFSTTVGTLRAARLAGAPGFRSGRLYTEEFQPWWEVNRTTLPVEPTGDDSAAEAKRRKAWAEFRRIDMANQERAGKLIDRSTVANAMSAMCARWNAERVRFEAEGPAKMAGKEADECRVVVREFTSEIGDALASCAEFFEEHSEQSK